MRLFPPRPKSNPGKLAAIAIIAILVLLIVGSHPKPILSNWVSTGRAGLAAESGGLIGRALPLAKALPVIGVMALEDYNQGSALQEDVAGQRVRFYRRDLPGGGSLAYLVVMLDEQVHIEVINADGATPTSDAQGDTIWTDGQQHLATVAEMAQAPYAARDGLALLGAMAFGFHGAERTSDEGSVVINSVTLRVNPGRAALCLSNDQRAQIGLFDAGALEQCQQAIGAGPVILWQGKIANPDIASETDEYTRFNPLNEDFVQLDWRKKIYSGLYPKTVIGVGARQDGRSYLVMAVSYGVTGIDLARQLKAMGCTDALGGDDDTSAQAVWRGTPFHTSQVREVPDALAVYLRGG